MPGVLAVPDLAYAEANWGRWIVRCNAPYCRSALQLPPGTPLYRCWDCGAVAEIVWPAQIDDIERVLMMRPDFVNRNWEPGETLHDLLAENFAHGIHPVPGNEIEAWSQRRVFGIESGPASETGRIACDVFDPAPSLATLGAAPPRPALGG